MKWKLQHYLDPKGWVKPYFGNGRTLSVRNDHYDQYWRCWWCFTNVLLKASPQPLAHLTLQSNASASISRGHRKGKGAIIIFSTIAQQHIVSFLSTAPSLLPLSICIGNEHCAHVRWLSTSTVLLQLPFLNSEPLLTLPLFPHLHLSIAQWEGALTSPSSTMWPEHWRTVEASSAN